MGGGGALARREDPMRCAVCDLHVATEALEGACPRGDTVAVQARTTTFITWVCPLCFARLYRPARARLVELVTSP